MHGGGFIAQTSKSHQSYLRQWSRNLNMPIFSVDYSLAPQAPYPRWDHNIHDMCTYVSKYDCTSTYHYFCSITEKIALHYLELLILQLMMSSSCGFTNYQTMNLQIFFFVKQSLIQICRFIVSKNSWNYVMSSLLAYLQLTSIK